VVNFEQNDEQNDHQHGEQNHPQNDELHDTNNIQQIAEQNDQQHEQHVVQNGEQNTQQNREENRGLQQRGQWRVGEHVFPRPPPKESTRFVTLTTNLGSNSLISNFLPRDIEKGCIATCGVKPKFIGAVPFRVSIAWVVEFETVDDMQEFFDRRFLLRIGAYNPRANMLSELRVPEFYHGKAVYISNMPYEVVPKDVVSMMQDFDVLSVEPIPPSHGRYLVRMASADAAHAAVLTYHLSHYGNRQIEVFQLF